MNDLQEIIRQLKKWIVLPLVGFLVLFFIIALNQALQLIERAFAVHAALGWILSVLIIALFLGMIVYPVLEMFRFRAVADLPQDKNSPEYPAYLQNMHQMVSANRFILDSGVAMPGEDREAELKKAYEALEKQSDQAIRKQAAQVFLTTAVSQNGSLDGIFVLTSLVRMLWQIIHLYEARPSLKRIITLYSNVAATILIARSLEDADLIEDQLEPLVSSLVGGSVITLVPGAVPVTNLVVSSVTEGSINALLTLRCGCIAQRYLSALSAPERRLLRRSASLKAGTMLTGILKENSLIIIRAVASATRNAAANVTVNRFRRKPVEE